MEAWPAGRPALLLGHLELGPAGTVRELRHIMIPIPDGMTPEQFREKFDALGTLGDCTGAVQGGPNFLRP